MYLQLLEKNVDVNQSLSESGLEEYLIVMPGRYIRYLP